MTGTSGSSGITRRLRAPWVRGLLTGLATVAFFALATATAGANVAGALLPLSIIGVFVGCWTAISQQPNRPHHPDAGSEALAHNYMRGEN